MPPGFADLGHFFPVSSQTSQTDKLVLLRMRDLIRKRGNYKYLEIGSYLGGSLTPFLMDPACQLVLSIDDRGRVLPDERASITTTRPVTTQSMLDNLLDRSGLKTDKLKTFDGSVNRLDGNYDSSFDLAFIDGEHTDEACFREFLLWTMPLMKSNAVIAFHDSSLIYKALKLIQLFLDKTKSGVLSSNVLILRCPHSFLGTARSKAVDTLGQKRTLLIFSAERKRRG